MRSLGDCDNHIFISYSHIDNRPLAEGQKGWIEAFHQRLELRLAQVLGEMPKVWRDPKLSGGDYFHDALGEQLARSALLLTVISPSYLKSEWCVKELQEFIRHADRTGGVRLLDHKSRVVKIVKTFTPREKHPPELQGMLGYEFYQINGETGRPEEFSPDEYPNRDPRYVQRFEDLVYELKQLIESLQCGVGGAATPADAPTGIAIYLAETTSDLSRERDQVRRELMQHRHEVLPGQELPRDGPSLEAAVREHLSRSRLSVHLIGDRYGPVPEMEETRSIVRLQLELAAEREGDPNFTQLIWMPVGLQPREKRQRLLIEELQNHPGLNHRSELLQTKLEDLKTVIQDKLIETAPRPESPPVWQSGLASVYLICDETDYDASRPVYDYLFDAGYEVLYQQTEGEIAQVVGAHKSILLHCDAVLIYYGRAGGTWVQMKLLELQKIAGYGRASPLLARAVYIGPPENQPKALFRTHGARVIRNYGGFTTESLAPFLAELRAAGGGRR